MHFFFSANARTRDRRREKAEGRLASVSRLEEDSTAEGETGLLSRRGGEIGSAGRGPVHTQVGRCARLIPLGHHEPFLSLSRPERPAAHPTAKQSRSSVRRRECTRVSVSSACRGRSAESTRRCVRDRRRSPLVPTRWSRAGRGLKRRSRGIFI